MSFKQEVKRKGMKQHRAEKEKTVRLKKEEPEKG